MIVELAAVRLLAPWFGASQIVWTNVIAVILLALSLGYVLGGRLAARCNPVASLGLALILAGLWVVGLPWLAPSLARQCVPQDMALHEAAELLAWASLALASLVFLPPATLLGTVCPLAIEALSSLRPISAGRTGGLVLCASTAGSLVGVFSTSLVLIPHLGIRLTFLLAGSLLLVAGAAAWFLWLRSAVHGTAASAVVILLAAGAARGGMPGPPPPAGFRELAHRESAYQYIRVVEQAAPVAMRFLKVNEGLDSFQSVWQPTAGLLPDGFYYNDFLLPACWVDPGSIKRVLVLGLGAGTVIRVFDRKDWSGTSFLGIELDSAIIAMARDYFGLSEEEDRLEVQSGLDARVALQIGSEKFDQIVVDCYSNQFEIPPHLCTREFFGEVHARLSPGGWLTANVGGFGFDDPVVSTVAATCAAAFGTAVLLVRVPMSRNITLLARRDARVPWDHGVLEPATSSASPLTLRARQLPGFARVVYPSSGGRILTDDSCPIERLQRVALLESKRYWAHTDT
jgi:spermidine synthase